MARNIKRPLAVAATSGHQGKELKMRIYVNFITRKGKCQDVYT